MLAFVVCLTYYEQRILHHISVLPDVLTVSSYQRSFLSLRTHYLQKILRTIKCHFSKTSQTSAPGTLNKRVSGKCWTMSGVEVMAALYEHYLRAIPKPSRTHEITFPHGYKSATFCTLPGPPTNLLQALFLLFWTAARGGPLLCLSSLRLNRMFWCERSGFEPQQCKNFCKDCDFSCREMFFHSVLCIFCINEGCLVSFRSV